MKIAIVGTGISGLVCARLLHERHDVTVFEANDRIGGHANTVDVRIGDERHAIDTGFIVYNDRTYPEFSKLLDQLGVETQPTDMSFGLRCDRTGLEWASHGLNAVFAQRRNLVRRRFLRLLRDILRFNREAKRLLESDDEKVALGDFLAGAGYTPDLVDRYVVPMGAAIWSASPAEFLRFPAITFVRFFHNHGLLDRGPRVSWRSVRGGSRRYVDALVQPFRDRVRSACPVTAIRRGPRAVALATRREVHRFDRVILAVHSDQALRLLVDASEVERRVLGSIRYQVNEAVLHTDRSVMPRQRRAWASWNYRIPAEARERVFVSYHMNRLQRLESRHEIFVTLNHPGGIDPDTILGRFVYQHPVFDADAVAMQKLHRAMDGLARTHFCGAYWGYGFHEDGIRSALAVCQQLERGA